MAVVCTSKYSNGTGNVGYGFAYNPAGQMKSVSRDNDEYAYTGSVSSNLVYAVNGLNQYTGVGTNAYQYDANGNLISDGGIGYGYDAENRLISSTQGASLVYDPLGRLFQTSGGSAGVTRFLYDGDNLVAEYDGGGGLLRRYMFGPGVDEPILWDEGGALNCSGTKVLHGDRQGSIVAAADCWGNRVAVRAYDEYGIPSGGNVGRFQYTGQAWLPELGMYYYKARIYSPTLGRFLQTDPVGYKDQVNLYAYVANDPVNHADPSGLEADDSWSSRAAQFLVGTAEATVGTLGMVAGAAGDIASGGLEIGTLGGATPIAVPAAAVSTTVMVGSAALAATGAKNMAGALMRNGDPNAGDRQRGQEQRDRRAERREERSRQGPEGNGQKRSGEGFRDRASANRGPSGDRPKGPDRSDNRERNRGIDEEHSMRPKGQQNY